MNINPVNSSISPERLNGLKISKNEAVPLDSFQSVSSNLHGTVNLGSAVNAVFGKKDLIRTKWSLKTDDANLLYNGTYCGSAPLKTENSLFVGDVHNYRRISQINGNSEWEFKLDANDSFVHYDPIVTKDNLICLRYDHGFIRKSDGFKDSNESLVVIDAENGSEKFRYAEKTGIYDRVNTDSKGNFYFATITDQKLYCVSPDGTKRQLNNPEEKKEEYLCDFKVTRDGTVFYPHLNSNKMVSIKNGKETIFKVEGKTIDEFHPLDNGQVIVISVNDIKDSCREVVSCYTDTGKKIWEKRIEEDFSHITVAQDGKMYLMRHGDDKAQKPTRLECLAADGTTQWQFSFDDPEINDSFRWLDCKFRVGPDGDLLILSNRGGNLLNIKPDGTLGWKLSNRGNDPKYSITHDEKLYIINNGDFEKLNLKTGKAEIDYNRNSNTLTRYAEDMKPEVFRSADEDLFSFNGIILEKDENNLFTLDEKGNFCAVLLPSSVESSDEQTTPSNRIEVLDDYVIIDGLMIPVNKRTGSSNV